MSFRIDRLRLGEWIAGGSAVLLLAAMLILDWYDGATGWQELTHLRWSVALTVLAASMLVLLQASRRSPALPVTMSVVVTVLALITVAWLTYRVLISVPPHQEFGAYLGLACAIGIVCGGWLSMRREGVSGRDQVSEIETVSLDGSPRGEG